jgi:hypothetical protein
MARPSRAYIYRLRESGCAPCNSFEFEEIHG